MRLDMLAWQQGRILTQAWRPQWSPERAHEGIQWGLNSSPNLRNTEHQHQQPPTGGQAQVQASGEQQVQQVQQVQYVPQGLQGQTGAGGLNS
jgi:hypothetical protein